MQFQLFYRSLISLVSYPDPYSNSCGWITSPLLPRSGDVIHPQLLEEGSGYETTISWHVGWRPSGGMISMANVLGMFQAFFFSFKQCTHSLYIRRIINRALADSEHGGRGLLD